MHNSALNLLLALQLAALGQLSIAVLNLFLSRILNWKPDVDRMPQLIREVFQVHAWFISITLAIFGIVTWRFAAELAQATNPIGTWLAAGIGLFWAVRFVLQLTYYNSSHWRGRVDRTIIHITLLVVYGGFAAAYLLAAF